MRNLKTTKHSTDMLKQIASIITYDITLAHLQCDSWCFLSSITPNFWMHFCNMPFPFIYIFGYLQQGQGSRFSYLPIAVAWLFEVDIFILLAVHPQGHFSWLIIALSLEFHAGHVVKEFRQVTLNLQFKFLHKDNMIHDMVHLSSTNILKLILTWQVIPASYVEFWKYPPLLHVQVLPVNKHVRLIIGAKCAIYCYTLLVIFSSSDLISVSHMFVSI